MKFFAPLFFKKAGGVQRQRLWPRSAERGTPLCLLKRRRGSKGEPSPGVPPFIYSCACAPFPWEVVVTLPCLSTPFLWCLPKETVSSRQRKALFYLGGSTIRVSAAASVDGGHLRPTLGGGWWLSGRGCVCAVTLGGFDGLPCLSTPFLWCLPKETVSSRQRKAL